MRVSDDADEGNQLGAQAGGPTRQAAEAASYRDGSPFPGVIARTVADSVPAWPDPVRARAGAPNVVVVLLDDTGFADFGCYGGAIRTPTFDRLASNGLRYREFHTTAMCTPSRASLLTGRNHHVNATGFVANWRPAGFPGYNTVIPRENGFLSEVLRGQGYATFAIGKWHLVPYRELAVGSSKVRWPLGRGFDRFYGFLSGHTSQWKPELVHDNHRVSPPRTPEEGYHLNVDMADRAIEFISDLRAVEPAKPFFLYYCPGATHGPHHVPREWADRYAGAFDHGWDQLRERVFSRQLEMGIVPEGTTLSTRPDSIQAWDSLDDQQRRVLARQMEVYAGFLEHTDHHIGRIVSFLETIGELNNTVLVVTSDNGAAGGGDTRGSEIRGGGDSPADLRLDDLGGPTTYSGYNRGWAWVGNTPLRKWKRYVHEGGVSDPLIVHWPDRIKARGEIRTQYTHITDLMPTLLEVLDLTAPREIGGATQSPIEGVSFAHTFDNPEAPTRKRVQYYEMTGSRAIWADGWKAVTEQRGGVLLDEEELAAQCWELFHVAEDFSESHDLAEENPDKLRQLVELWWTEAGKHGVLPLSAHHDVGTIIRTGAGPSDVRLDRPRFVYYPRAATLPGALAPNLAGRSHRITAHIEIPDDGAQGVLLTHGGRLSGGYSLYIKNRRLCYVQAHPGNLEQRVTSETLLLAGSHTVEIELTMTDDERGSADLRIDGVNAGSGGITRIMPKIYARGVESRLCCGYDDGDPVTNDYQAAFRFTGEIKQVIVEFTDAKADEVHP